MRTFAIILLVFICAVTMAFTILSFTTQNDTLPRFRKDSISISPEQALQNVYEKTDSLAGSIEQNLGEFKSLPLKQDRIISNDKETAQILKSKKKDIEPIERIYTINTDPKPLIITLQTVQPCTYVETPKRKLLFFRRKD